MSYGIWIHGKPQPKQRPRLGRNRTTFTPIETVEYEALIAKAWRDKYGDKQVEPENLVIHVDVYTKRYSTSDIDNFLKIAMDGLQGVAYKNDSCIKAAKVVKVKVDPPGTDEGMRIALFEFGDNIING